jgi:hypothetical protein
VRRHARGLRTSMTGLNVQLDGHANGEALERQAVD